MAWIFTLLLLTSLPERASACQGPDEPLLLTPYLDRGQAPQARSLSRVDRNCVREFVPDSYTGYLTTDKNVGNHLFFWFFPATQNNDSAPLLFWLNGGPTSSSMIGLFWEHGPMRMDSTVASDYGYEMRDYSWASHFSMIYVDNPVGTGYSYTDTVDPIHNAKREVYTENMANFVSQFFKLFPDFKSRDFYIGGQSYAGKYVPALAHHIHTDIQAGKSDIKLTGVYLGNPLFDSETQMPAYNELLYSLGIITYHQLQEKKAAVRLIHDSINSPHNSFHDLIFEFIHYKTFESLHNFVTQKGNDFRILHNILGPKNSKLRNATHAGNVPFNDFNGNNMYDFFGKDLLLSSKSELAELMNNYKVLIYNGNFDAIVSSPMIEAALMSMSWKHQEDYSKSSRTIWTKGEKGMGYYTHVGQFCRVVIHGAGHQVPNETPEVALIMMKQFIEDGCVSPLSESDFGGLGSPLLKTTTSANQSPSSSPSSSLSSLLLRYLVAKVILVVILCHSFLYNMCL